MRHKTFAGIDYFRLIAAFMVIAIHISPLSVWSEGIDYLITYCIGRIAILKRNMLSVNTLLKI